MFCPLFPSTLRLALLTLLAFFCASCLNAETWQGLTVADESKCSPYDREKDYEHPEKAVAERQGMVSRYTGRKFDSLQDSQVDHIVALSEAHDSGLCMADQATRYRFAHDLDNLTLASRKSNGEKGARDAADWLPPENHCWFARQVIAIKKKYNLTVDPDEVEALAGALADCD